MSKQDVEVSIGPSIESSYDPASANVCASMVLLAQGSDRRTLSRCSAPYVGYYRDALRHMDSGFPSNLFHMRPAPLGISRCSVFVLGDVVWLL